MTIKEFKEKLTQTDYKTGARKVAVGITLVVSLMVAGTTMAHAAVPAENIIGDAQLNEDRTRIKVDDSQDILLEFYGYNKYGRPTVSMTDIRKAIELSDVLNGYYFDAVEYTNTTKEEVLSLDIEKIYEEYLIAKYGKEDKTAEFCSAHLEDKPAIDAYITFACGTVANNIQNTLAEKLNTIIAEEGQEMTLAPRTIVNNGSLYVIVEVNGQTQLIELTGLAAADMATMISNLDNHAKIALNNIAGTSSEYENTFAYNGVNKYTNESVWLSFPDDTKQERIEEGIQAYEGLEYGYGYELICENPEVSRELTKAEKQMLRDLGYDKVQVNQAVRREALLNKVLEQSFTK